MQLLASITFGQDRSARGAARSTSDDVAALEELRAHGVLTSEEFQRAKEKALV